MQTLETKYTPGSPPDAPDFNFVQIFRKNANLFAMKDVFENAEARPGLPADDITRFYKTPLHYQACLGNAGAVRELLESGAKANTMGHHKLRPLHFSVNHPEVTRLLLEHGAHVKAQSRELKTPLEETAEKGSVENAEVLLEGGAKATGRALFLAVSNGRADMVKLLLLHKAPIDDLVQGRTPLYWAAYRSRTEVVKLLLENGADPAFRYKGVSISNAAGKTEWNPENEEYVEGKGTASGAAQLVAQALKARI